MKTIIATQIGFLIGNLILIMLFDFELKMTIANHLILSLGYFCRYTQERGAKQTQVKS